MAPSFQEEDAMRWKTFIRYPLIGYGMFLAGVVCGLVVSRIDWTSHEEVHMTQSEQDWRNFWGALDGTFRRQYSEPAGERLRRVAAIVVADTRALGFALRTPKFAQTSLAYHERVPLASQRYLIGDPFMGGFFPGPNRIVINSGYMAAMDDEMLYVLVAHEVGHAVDMQTERVGHPIMERWANFPREHFADIFSLVLAGMGDFVRFKREYTRDPDF